MTDKASLDAYIASRRTEAEELLTALGKIPAPSHEEDERARFIGEWLRARGAAEAFIDEAKNVVCPIGCGGTGKIRVFMAHTDIVFPDREELPLRREGNRLYAPGIGDDTANLVNLMMGARFLLEKNIRPGKGILIVANSCEEGLGNLKGCRRIFEDYGDRIDEFISLDGYLPSCTDTPVGSHRYRVTVRAQGGHSFSDFGRENAIVTLAALIGDLYRIVPPDRAKTTYNAGMIEGGTTINSIPQEASVLYEYRSSDQSCLDMMEREFNRTVESYRERGATLETELLGVRPGMGPLDRKSFDRWTEANLDVIRRHSGETPRRDAKSTDANIPLSRGVFANTIGTVRGGGAHTRQEWVDLESLATGMGIVLELLLREGRA